MQYESNLRIFVIQVILLSERSQAFLKSFFKLLYQVTVVPICHGEKCSIRLIWNEMCTLYGEYDDEKRIGV